MTVKITSIGMPASTAIATPLPVVVQGGEIAVLEGVPVSSVWAGPKGYHEVNDRQVTATNPGTAYVAGAGATASDAVKAGADWDDDTNRADFLAEFPNARPGVLYGIIYVAWGNSYGTIEDMYGPDTTSTKAYRDRESWAYDSNYFSLGKMFEPKTSSGGLWQITFPKPIPFHLGLRVSYDNGVARYYFCYSLDPSFA